MLTKLMSAAVVAVGLMAGAAMGQGLSGPAELPPPGYAGQQYVDSRGCVFLRAGYGGQVSWVPRVTRDRRQLCGQGNATGRPVEVAEPAPPAAAPAPAAPAVTTRRPMETVATTTTPPTIRQPAPPTPRAVAEAYRPAEVVVAPRRAAPAPAPAPAPRQVVVRPAPAPAPAPAPRAVAKAAPLPGTPAEGLSVGGLRVACPKSAPHATRVPMHGGGTKLFCLGPDRTLASAVLPVLVKGSVSGGSKSYKYPPTPEGYEPAWDDGRLNPNRGKQTVEGVIDQDEIWTRTVPSELREDSKVQRKRLVIVERPTVAAAEPRREAVRASSKAAGGRYVQVGTFGVPANADGAAARLSSLGLPVARSRVQKGGRTLQIVLAGPFASQGEVQAALSAARRAGFGDAIVR